MFATRRRIPLKMKLGIVAICMLIVPIWGHQDDPKLLDVQPPYRGPGYLPATMNKSGMKFQSQNINLESWMTLEDLEPGSISAADIWGYTSASGREYAIIAADRSKSASY